MIRLKHLLELVTRTRIECDACSWSWKIADGGDDVYMCHRCGHDNTPIAENVNPSRNMRTNMLAEITMGSIAPYATQFVWNTNDNSYETKVQCDGITVLFEMGSQYSREGEEYSFAIAMPGSTGSGFTVTHAKSGVAGQLSYLRVLRTALEAILDFCAQYAPSAIDVTGFDTEADKDLQKTRIYRDLLMGNKMQLEASGYLIFYRNGKLWIVRKHAYDATGVRND